MILRCAITDDEPLALNLMESYVKKTPGLELVGKYSNAVEALSGLRDNPVDLLFLDIQMPQMDGLELSRIVDSSTRIVFTTAFDSYAIDSYKVNALDYLMKPISYPEFLQAVDKAARWFELVNSTSPSAASQQEAGPAPAAHDSIFVKSEYKQVQIMLDDIFYIEGLKDYVKIITESSAPVLSLMSLKTLEAQLPSDKFMRVHKSFIVNTKKIREVNRSWIIFGDVQIPIGDSYKDDFQSFIARRSV